MPCTQPLPCSAQLQCSFGPQMAATVRHFCLAPNPALPLLKALHETLHALDRRGHISLELKVAEHLAIQVAAVAHGRQAARPGP